MLIAYAAELLAAIVAHGARITCLGFHNESDYIAIVILAFLLFGWQLPSPLCSVLMKVAPAHYRGE